MDNELIIKKTKKNSFQDKRLENRSISILLVLDTFQASPDALLILANCGYSNLTEGFSLQTMAQSAIHNRLVASAAQLETTQNVQIAKKSARVAYSEFRTIAQIVFKTDAARTALGLRGRIPADRARFLRHARASFEAALTPDFAPALARRGVPEAVIRDGLARLDALAAADAAQLAAKAAAQQATADRQAAMRRLDDWFIEFRDIAKIALRDHIEWLPLLKIRK